MTNPLIPYVGDLYTGGVKAQTFTIPAAQSASYWTAADTAAVSGIIADIINNGTVPLSTSLGSISGAFSATIGSISGAFSSTIGSISGAFSSTIAAIVAGSATVDAEARATATLALYDASQAQLTANSKGNAWLTSSHLSPAGNALAVTGTVTSTGSAGSVLVGNSSEFGVTVSASGMASYVGFTATNPSGSAIDATINPNNGAIVFNLGHNPTDGGTDASTIQAATNNGFVNSGGPTFMGQHASLPFRIYGTSGLAFGTTSADVNPLVP